MSPFVESNPRRWTVDLELGERWWILPLLVVAVPAGFRIYAEVSGYNWGQARTLVSLDTIAFAIFSGMSGIPYAAAVLNAPGATLRHRATSVGILIAGITICSPHFRPPMYAFIFLALAGVQFAFASFLRWPRWRVGPALNASRRTSIAHLLIYTAATAAFIAAAINLLGENFAGSLPRYIAVTLTLWLVAQYFGSVRYRQVSAFVGFVFLLAFELPLLFELTFSSSRFRGISMMIMIHALVLLPPWAICYFHRCDGNQSQMLTAPRSSADAAGSV